MKTSLFNPTEIILLYMISHKLLSLTKMKDAFILTPYDKNDSGYKMKLLKINEDS